MSTATANTATSNACARMCVAVAGALLHASGKHGGILCPRRPLALSLAFVPAPLVPPLPTRGPAAPSYRP